MSNRINFTDDIIASLMPSPTGKRAYYNDTRVPGLQLQVTERGVKTFYVYRRVNKRPTRIKLGRHPDMKPAQARINAKIIIGQIAQGNDPVALKSKEEAERVTLIDAFEEFLKVRPLKPKTAYDYRRVIEVAFPDWKTKRLAHITKDMVGARHQTLGKGPGATRGSVPNSTDILRPFPGASPGTPPRAERGQGRRKGRGEAYANLSMRVLNAVYNFARERYQDENGESLLPPNPVRRLSATRAWFRSKPRSRYIPRNQLKAWFHAVLDLKKNVNNTLAVTVADFLLLLIFTGLRRSEGANLTWDTINLETRTLTVHDTKNHESHTLPLPTYLHQLLSERKRVAEQAAFPSRFVFPGRHADTPLVEPRNYIDQVIEDSGIMFTLHDLRRTFVTIAVSLDIGAYAIKRMVNHKMRNDVTADYIGHDIERLRSRMQQICDFLVKEGEIKEGKMIILPSRRMTYA